MNQQQNNTQTLRLKFAIQAKKQPPIKSSKAILDWKAAELTVCQQLSPSLIPQLTQLQNICKKQQIGCFYSFFIMQYALKNSNIQALLPQQIASLAQQQSKYHSISSYVAMREHLLSKIQQASNNKKSFYEDIDDIRFLNIEIVSQIQSWKNMWRVEGESEPVFYLGNINYLLKINNDNADIINIANLKKNTFISPPNPFFMTPDGNVQGMSGKQKQDINNCMEVINRERGIDVKMSIGGALYVRPNLKNHKPHLKASRNKEGQIQKDSMESSFVCEAKKEMQFSKEEQIRKIYKINKSLERTKTKANEQKQTNLQIRKQSNEQRESEKIKMYSSQKFLSKRYSSQKSIAKVNIPKQPSIINMKLSANKPEPSRASSHNIRKQVEKASNDLEASRARKQLNQRGASPIQVREIKPKIKLIEQKQSIVQQSTAERPVTRSNHNSTFYKKITPIAEQSQDSQIPTTQHVLKNRAMSQSAFYPIKKIQNSKKQGKQIEGYTQEVETENTKVQTQIRNLNNQIRNLTIINIYKGKQAKNRNVSLSNVKSKQIQKPQQPSFLTEINPVEQKMAQSQLTYDKIENKNKTQLSKHNDQLERRMSKMRKNEQILQQKQRQRLQAEKQLLVKQMVIDQLQKKIQNLQSAPKSLKKKQAKNEHAKQFERSKKIKEIQSKILKDKIRFQQQKLTSNKQLQLKLKEKQIKLQLKKDMKALQHESSKQRKQFEHQIQLQQRKLKQTQGLIVRQKHKHKQIERELQRRKAKEAMLRKIIEEKQSAAHLQSHEQKETEGRIQKQLKLKQRLQLQSLKHLQEEKRKMQQLYREMQLKNREIEEQNNLKLKQLEEIDQHHLRELEKIKLLEQEYQNIRKQPPKQAALEQEKAEGEDMESLKLKLKQELLEEIVKKQEEEEREERENEERRRLRLKKIQEEVALALRDQEESIERDNAEYLGRLEQLRHSHLLPATHEQSEEKQQLSISSITHNEKAGPTHQETFTLQLKTKQQEQEAVDREINDIIEKGKAEERKQIEKAQHGQEEVEVLKQEPISPLHSIPQTPPKGSQAQIQGESHPQDLLQKYKHLGQYLKKTKQLLIEDSSISSFLDNFILQLQKPIRQMLPWNRFDLERIFHSRPVDIFEYNSIGWLQEKGKYYLVGGVEGIENIIKKYGNVEIHQLLVFDRNNPYQKQVLTKKMKMFESIGFVYQRKIDDSNKYSIRFVIKVPKEIAASAKIIKPKMISTLSLSNQQQSNDNIGQQDKCFHSYLASLIVQEHSSKILQQKSNQLNQYINRQIALGTISNTYKHLTIEAVNCNVRKLEVQFPLRYHRNYDRAFYIANCVNYLFEGEHFYVVFIEQGLSIIIQQVKNINLTLDTLLFDTVEKVNSGKKECQIDICLPLWRYSHTFKLMGGDLNLQHQWSVEGEFVLGSIVNTLKHQHINVKAPFVAGFFEMKKEVAIRPIIGHLINQSDLIQQNLK